MGDKTLENKSELEKKFMILKLFNNVYFRKFTKQLQ